MKQQQLSESVGPSQLGVEEGMGAALGSGDDAWLLARESVLQPIAVACLVGFVLIVLRETLAVVVDLLLLRNGKGRNSRFPRSMIRNNLSYYEEEQARQLRSSKLFFFNFRPFSSIKRLSADMAKRLVRLVMLCSCVCFLLLPLSVPSAHLFAFYHEHVIFSKLIVALVAAALILSFLRLFSLGGFLVVQYLLVLCMTSSMFAQFCVLLSRNFSTCRDMSCLVDRLYDKTLLAAEAKAGGLLIIASFLFYISRSFVYVYLLYSGVLGTRQSPNYSATHHNSNTQSYDVHTDVGQQIPAPSPRRLGRHAGATAAASGIPRDPHGMRYATSTYRSIPTESIQGTGVDRLASRMKSARSKETMAYTPSHAPAGSPRLPHQPQMNAGGRIESPNMRAHPSPRTRPAALPRSHTDHVGGTGGLSMKPQQQPAAYSLPPHGPPGMSPAFSGNMSWYQPANNPMSPSLAPGGYGPHKVGGTPGMHFPTSNAAVHHNALPTVSTSPETYPWLYDRGGGTRFDAAAKTALPNHQLSRLGSGPVSAAASVHAPSPSMMPSNLPPSLHHSSNSTPRGTVGIAVGSVGATHESRSRL